jgi:phage protein D
MLMAEEPLSHYALYSARPTIRVNGAESERVTGLLLAMELTEQESGLSALELRLSNVASLNSGTSELAFEDESSLKFGDKIAVYAGGESSPTEIFSGLVTGLEADFPANGSPTLSALAEDRLQEARTKRRTRTFESSSLADIARLIAADHGLTPVISGFDTTLPVEVQMNESDLAFLRRLLARYDGDLQVVGDDLQIAPRGEVRRNEVDLAMHSQLRRATVLADLAHQASEVTVTGWDAGRGERFTGRSTGVHPGPGQGRAARDVLLETVPWRSMQMSHFAISTSDEAGVVADRLMDDRQRRFVTLHGTAEGNPAVRVGSHVTLTGLGPRFSNTYYVTSCRHRFDLQAGYETDFTAECGFLGSPASAPLPHP